MYEMKPDYYTGIEMIDQEHTKLFAIANQVYELSKEFFLPDKYDSIQAILNELVEYTTMHFAHEEEYMKSIEYKRMFMQKVQHDEFKAKLEAIAELNLEVLEAEQDKVIENMLAYLTDWLVNHILYCDKEIGK